MNTVIKKLLGIITVVAIVAAAGWNFSQSQNEVEMSDLALANVEALARYELPDVEIVCGQRQGQCWTTDYDRYYNCGEYTMVHPCTFSGSMSDSCVDPCKR